MPKTIRNKRKILLALVYSLSIIILSVLNPALIRPVFAYYTTEVFDETRYVDKYFEIDKDGNFKINIYLGDQKIAISGRGPMMI